MENNDFYKLALEAISDYEDGFTGVSRCCELYCEDNNLPEEIAEDMSEAYYKKEREQFSYMKNYPKWYKEVESGHKTLDEIMSEARKLK